MDTCRVQGVTKLVASDLERVLTFGGTRPAVTPPRRPYRQTTPHFTPDPEPPADLAPPSRVFPRPAGGKLRYLVVKKAASSPKCGDCHIALPGVPALRPRQYAQISKRQKTVQRAYGGSRCATCVRDRIVRSFLVEEAKIVKRVIASQKTSKA